MHKNIKMCLKLLNINITLVMSKVTLNVHTESAYLYNLFHVYVVWNNSGSTLELQFQHLIVLYGFDLLQSLQLLAMHE